MSFEDKVAWGYAAICALLMAAFGAAIVAIEGETFWWCAPYALCGFVIGGFHPIRRLIARKVFR